MYDEHEYVYLEESLDGECKIVFGKGYIGEVRMMRIEPPMRIDCMSESTLNRTLRDFYEAEKDGLFTLTVEEPLPSAKERGVYKIIFINKEMIEDGNLTWFMVD